MTEDNPSRFYSFVYRGILTDTALSSTKLLSHQAFAGTLDRDMADRLSLDQMDEDIVYGASRMAVVYAAIAAFENSLRKFITRVMLENCGDNWWQNKVSEKIQKNAERRKQEEEKVKWHSPRGGDPISYTDFGDATSIIIQNWALFEPHFNTQDWIKNIISTLERSRNVIMHSGNLENADTERIGTVIRDWIRQIGTIK